MAADGKVDRAIFLRYALSSAAVLVTVELAIAVFAGQPMLPFALCGLAFLACVAVIATRKSGPTADGGRLLAILFLLKIVATVVGVTGGAASLFSGLLYLPVFIAALYFGMAGGLTAGAAVCVILCLVTIGHGDYGKQIIVPLLIDCIVMVTVSLGAGTFVQRIRRTASKATKRATLSAARADKVEWFTDTAVMMESLYETGTMLSAALLRLKDLVKCDTAAFYLKDQDDTRLGLAQTLGIPIDQTPLKSIPLGRHDKFRNADYTGLYLPNTLATNAEPGVFGRLNPEARSVIVVALRTPYDLIGILYIGSNQPDAFNERTRESLLEFAGHVIYPIQRVRLQTLASTDALTGLNNRRAFRDRLREEVERASRYNNPLSLIMIDIDKFKGVNDTHGHRAGDAILMQVGGILLKVSRITDFAARYGGEEMCVICPETNGADAQAFAERIRVAVGEATFDLQNGKSTSITVSAGVGTLRLGEKSEATLVEAADLALYEAKAQGRNRVVLGANA